MVRCYFRSRGVKEIHSLRSRLLLDSSSAPAFGYHELIPIYPPGSWDEVAKKAWNVTFRSRAKKSIPFSLLPRNRQKHHYILAKNLIHRAAGVLSGAFYTHHYMHGTNGWVDGYFLGKHPPIFYNFTLETTPHAYMNLVFEADMDRADELAPQEGDGDWLLKIKPDQPYQIPNLPYPELGGLTKMEWVVQQLPEMVISGNYHVVEKWSIRRDYGIGIGLHATINVPLLTVAAVIAFIQRFLEGGESDFINSDHLTYAHDEIAFWGFETNAIIEPWKWAAAAAD